MPSDRMPSRLLARLNSVKKEKQFYEAHQIYRTLFHRLTAAKKYDEVIGYMEEGAQYLLSHNEYESGTDLALLLLESLKKRDGVPCPSTSEIQSLARLHSYMTTDTPERSKFIENTITFLSEDKSWQPQLFLFNELIAYNFWNVHDYPRARYHFIHSKDGYACANLLIEFHLKRGYPSEIDLFIVQAVLQYLCLDKHNEAAICFHTYTRRHPRLDPGPPFKSSPLLNFIWFLLLATAEREKCQPPLYHVLVNAYQRHLLRDPDYPSYVEKIGELFFHLPKPKQQPNMISGLLSSLGFGNLAGNNDTSGPSTSTSNTLRSEDVD